jgi:hypothetical protein
VRTQTLVKNAIIQVDANPFKQWYQQHYGAEIGAKKRSAAAQAAAAETAVEEKSASNHIKRKLAVRAMEGLCFRASAVYAHHQLHQQCPTVSDMGRSTMRIWCCICTMTRDLSCSLRRGAGADQGARRGHSAGRAVRHRAAVRVHRLAARPVRPLRRLHSGGQGAGVLCEWLLCSLLFFRGRVFEEAELS